MEKSLREWSQYAGFQAKKEHTLLKALTVVQEEEVSDRSDEESTFRQNPPSREDAPPRLGQVALCSACPTVCEWYALTVVGMHLCLQGKAQFHAGLAARP